MIYFQYKTDTKLLVNGGVMFSVRSMHSNEDDRDYRERTVILRER